MTFSLTEREQQARDLMGSGATHILLYGGSRSGKTFSILRAIASRAVQAPGSRHAVLRFRLNHLKASILEDTWPKMLSLCFPEQAFVLNKSDFYGAFPNGSQVWFGGLDDKQRTEKILGQEYVSIFLNECSQIPWDSRNMALTRLAQAVDRDVEGMPKEPLPRRMYYDENPPNKAHWSYKAFIQHRDPDNRTRKVVPEQYASMQMNPADNLANLGEGYLDTLAELPKRLQVRFLAGEFADANPNALFADTDLERWRVMDGELPDMQRVVVAVDPSGSDDEDNADNDEIGIVVCGLGTDGNGYVLEDLTIRCGPLKWGGIATAAYERHKADRIVAEKNYGGAMVEHVIQTARPHTPFTAVTASRGKVVRAEPISALCEKGKVRLVGDFPDLEHELSGFSTTGYTGDESPNRADAFIWGMSDLFPGIVRDAKRKSQPIDYTFHRGIV